MADFDSVRQTIDASIKQNGTGAITGTVLNGVLNEMVDAADDQVSQLSQEVGEKVEQLSVNLVNPAKFTLGRGLYPNGTIANNADLNLSDYIPVNGQNIACNGYSSTYWRAGVYDENRQWLRAVTSNYYTYQEGDAYLRINFRASNTTPMANYGGDVLPYEKYMPIEGYLVNSPSLKKSLSLIESERLQNSSAPIDYFFELGTVDASMVESESERIARSNIFRVETGRTLSVIVPDGYQYIIYASSDEGATYIQQNTWAQAIKFMVAASEPGYVLVRVIVRKANNSKIAQRELLSIFVALDGGIVDTFTLDHRLTEEKTKGIFKSLNNSGLETTGSSVTPTSRGKSYLQETIRAHGRNYPMTRRIVAVNHDDLTKIDYFGTRQIYNKYDFHANFNYILYPFANVTERDLAVKKIKKLIEEGHSIGLHAYFSSTAWIKNKLFDVRPDGSATFAPTAAELKPTEGTSVNFFGVTVSASTKFRDLGYVNPPTSVADINVVDCTQDDVNTLTQNYCVFTQTENITGLDLDGNIVTKTRLGWAEYWYNNLISNIGYSTEGTIAERFAADYSIPEGGAIADYYPDAAHLLNGKVVFFDDTSNPNYNNSEYQKVGRFARGLFKGCASTRNCEVVDRIINLATMVARHYFGLDHFEHFGRHGVQYAEIYWSDNNGYPYDNREKTVLHHERGRWYNTQLKVFMTAYDAFEAYGIRMSPHSNIMPAKFGGELGLYFGQSNKRSDNFNEIRSGVDGLISFMQLLGTDGDTMTYSRFINFFGGKANWIKYAYENAGKVITGSDSTTIRMSEHLKKAIDIIRALKDTNKIPMFSFDTIKDNYSCQVGVDLLCRYCFQNSIQIVTPEVARQMAVGYGVEHKQNYYPNPKFRQSLIEQFGEFTAKDAYMPDSIKYVSKVNNNNDIDISVSSEVIDNTTQKVLSQTNVCSDVRLFGLPSGNYRFSIKAKGRGTIFILLNKNGELAFSTANLYARAAHYISVNTNDWAEHTYDFAIDEPYLGNIDPSSAASLLSCGGQDNIINFEVIYYGDASEPLLICCPRISELLP